MKVTVNQSNIIQATDYYPFGLQYATSWTRPTTPANKHLYNAGSELNETTGNYETYLRNYDPALGRFTGVDVLAGLTPSMNPYQYGGNNPAMYNDPTGAYMERPSWNKSYWESASGLSGDFDPGLGGGYWSNGSKNTDWTMAGGSETYRQGQAMGLMEIGGIHYQINDDGSRDPFGKKGQQFGFWVYNNSGDPGDLYYENIDGMLVMTLAPITIGAKFVNSNGGMQAGIFSGFSQEELNAIQPYSDPILGVGGAITSMAETVALARAVQLKGLTSTLNVTRLATATKFAKGAGAFGLVLGAAGASVNIYTGNGHGNDVLDIAVMAGAGLVGIAVGAAALPWIAGGAMVYGILSFTFQDQINASGVGQNASSIGNSVLTYFGSNIKIK